MRYCYMIITIHCHLLGTSKKLVTGPLKKFFFSMCVVDEHPCFYTASFQSLLYPLLLVLLFGRCNFLNYRRNMACFHCECKRPSDEFMENKMQEKQRGPSTRLERTAHRQEVSNAWNFDFDDNESDGADVAAFEYADSSVVAEDSPLDNQAHGGNFRGPEGNFSKASRVPRVHEKEYSDGDTNRPGMGFDDFEDEEDNIDSYELEIPHNNSARKASSNEFSEAEGYSGSEDFEGINNNVPTRRRPSSPSYNKPSKSMHRNAAFSGSEDDLVSDEDLSVHPNWKSSHVADSRQRSRGQAGPSKGLSFGSDEELGLYSDVDDDLDENFRSRQKNGNRLGSGRRDFRRKGSSDVEDGRFSGPDFDSDDMHSSRNRLRGNKVEPDRRRNNSQGRANHNFTRDTKFRSSSKMGSRRNSFNDDFDEPFQGSRGNNRGSQKTRHDGGRKRDREGDMWNSKARGRGDSFGKQQRGRRNEYDRDMDRDSGEFKNSRRVVER